MRPLAGEFQAERLAGFTPVNPQPNEAPMARSKERINFPEYYDQYMKTAMFGAMLAGWELYWRAYGVTPTYRNSDGQWLEQRRRIDAGEGGKTVLVGASRILFDTSLPGWEKVTGKFSIEAFNLFNRAQFGAPDTNLNDGGYGTVTHQANTPRVLQAAFRLSF